MKRILSTVIAIALLVGLAGLAVVAGGGAKTPLAAMPARFASALNAPGAQAEVAAPAAPVAQDEANAPAAVDSIAATNKINEVALPLDVQSSFTVAGLPFTAVGLARNISSGWATVAQVTHWNATMQQNDTWTPTGESTGYGVYNGTFTTTPWALQTGQAYRLLLKAGASTVYSIVGDVPAQGALHYTWVGGSGTACKTNSFLVPLDQEQSLTGKDLSNADKLATDIGRANLSQISRWNATYQQADTWTPTGTSGGYGVLNGTFTTTPFPVTLGYPYRICAKSGLEEVIWP